MPTQILHQKIREIPQNYPKWVIRDWMTTVSDSNTSLNIIHISCSARTGLQLFHQRQRHHTCLDVSLMSLHRNKWWTHRPSDLFACFFFLKKNVSEKKLSKRGPFWANLDLSERQAEVPNRSPLNSLPRLQPSWWPPRTVLHGVQTLIFFVASKNLSSGMFMNLWACCFSITFVNDS